MMIQDEFNIELSDDVAEAVITVGDAIYVVTSKPRANRSRGKMSRAGTKAGVFPSLHCLALPNRSQSYPANDVPRRQICDDFGFCEPFV